MKYRNSLFNPNVAWCDNDAMKKVWSYVGNESLYDSGAWELWREARQCERMGLTAPIISMYGKIGNWGSYESPLSKDSLETMASRIILW